MKTICEYADTYIARKYAPAEARPIVNKALRELTAPVLEEQPRGGLVNRHAVVAPDAIYRVRVTRGKRGKLRTSTNRIEMRDWSRGAWRAEYGGLGWVNCPDCYERLKEATQNLCAANNTIILPTHQQAMDARRREADGSAYRRAH